MKTNKQRIQRITGIGLLSAAVIVLQFVSMSLRFTTFSITLTLIPIVVGAAIYGIGAGAWLGLVFGLAVLLTGDAASFMAVSFPGTIITVLAKGVLAGFPVASLKANLYDGSYHDVDSSEMAFKLAAALAFKDGLKQASPIILEPIGNLSVIVPDAMMGDIIGDINKRRGRVLGMNPQDEGVTCVEADVPMAETGDYATMLRSLTQGRGSFIVEFDHYEEAPAPVAQKIIETYKTEDEG